MTPPPETLTGRTAPTEAPDLADDRIAAAWRELRRCSRQLRTRAQVSERQPLDTAELDALEFLVQRKGWRMSELAGVLRVDASTATRAVDSLVSAGLATRARAADDARCVLVDASQQGRRRYAAHEEHRRRLLKLLLEDFSERERQTMASLMERLVSAVDRLLAQPLPG
jgi:DNA-binding MarR family transcriptional regulator